MDTKLFIAVDKTTIFDQIMYELRDEQIQQDSARFRRNLEKAGMFLAYEISRQLSYEKKMVTTALGEIELDIIKEFPVIVSILRAGIPLHNGFLEVFDKSDNGFVSAFRHHSSSNKFTIKVEYASLPDVEGRTLILVDPMIATGSSIVKSYETIINQFGKPKTLFIAGVIASEQGVDFVRRHIPNARIYLGAVDKELTGKSYIVPGLGDAGDLAFGKK